MASALRDGRDHLDMGKVCGGRERLSAGERVSRGEADHVREGNHQVAHGQENNRPLRVAKPIGVDEKGQHREQARDRAQDGPEAHPDTSKVTLLVGEEGAVARGAAVPLHLVPDAEFVVEHARHFELHRADEAVVAGALGQRREIAQPRRRVVARNGRVEARRGRRRLRGILREANLRTMLGKIVTFEIGGPLEAELVHERFTAVTSRQAEGTARGQRLVQDGAHGRVDRAEEHLQVRRAFHFD